MVSLLGGLTRVSTYNPSEFAWRFADKIAADCYLMAAPVYAPDARTRDALVNHPGIREVFEHSQRLDLALLSVGDLSPESTHSTFRLLERGELASLERAGAIGDILCRFINAKGQVLDHPVNDRVIAADPRDLRSARRIVLASGGWNKTRAILAAIRLLKPEVLITDENVAERLAESRRPPEGQRRGPRRIRRAAAPGTAVRLPQQRQRPAPPCPSPRSRGSAARRCR